VKQRLITFTFLLTVLLIGLATNANAQTNTPVVHAVLFYSPTCGHCEYVITNTLLPMVQKYGEQLRIIALDVAQPQGQTIFLAAAQKYNLERAGVPFLVFDDMYLIGSLDIPEKFPELVETYLAQGGVEWPDIPGLDEVLSQASEAGDATSSSTPKDDPIAKVATQSAAYQTTPVPATVTPVSASPTATPVLALTYEEDPTWSQLFARDLAGNTLAVLVLGTMLGTVAWTITHFQKTKGVSVAAWLISQPSHYFA
jgi:thiol-disulfide isomerase/thioredoxin